MPNISATPRKLTRIHQTFGVFLHPQTPTLIVSNLIPDHQLKKHQLSRTFGHKVSCNVLSMLLNFGCILEDLFFLLPEVKSNVLGI